MNRTTSLWFLCLFSIAYTQAFELKIDGLTPALQKNVEGHLAPLIKEAKELNDRLQARIEESIHQALRAKGYYEPQILSLTVAQKSSSPGLLKLEINPGRALILAGVEITLEGAAKSDMAYQTLLEQERPAVGEVLDHGQFDRFLSRLSHLAAQRGYFDAELTRTELQVIPESYQAFWKITLTSGKRYCFGPVTFRGSQIADPLIHSLIPFKVGDPYLEDHLLELNRRLSATQWFTAVTVIPQLDHKQEKECLPLLALVTPRKKNSVELGVGYSTGKGPGIRINWNKPWINARGHSIENQLQVAKPEQKLLLNYRLPLQKNPLEQYYLFAAGLESKRQNDTYSNAWTLQGSRYLDRRKGWQPALHLYWRCDHFTQGSQPPLTTYLLYPGMSINRTRQRGGPMPEWGDSQRYTINFSPRLWRTAVAFSHFQLKNVWIRTLKQHHRCLLRAEAGWINTKDFSRVPSSLRFFGGGDGSLRGYPYRQISPKDTDGKLTGASRLATGSLEYQYHLSTDWWLALFVDSGLAAHQWRSKAIKRGAGVGLRWSSPVGPIKVDIARAIGNKQQRKLQFYLAFGSEL